MDGVPFIVLPIVFVVSCGLTWRIRSYCLANGIVNIPNQRSSHTQIVARGGGVGFSVTFLAAMVGLGLTGVVSWRPAIALTGGGAIIGLTGWVDDRQGLTQLTRIVLHLSAAVWAVEWIGGVPQLFPVPPVVALVIPVILIIAVAWLVNLYNFMDGTDGIAGIEAVTVALMSGALCTMAGVAVAGRVYYLLAAAVAGFLVWNWPPARIFMGDAGSGFLGFAFAATALWCATDNKRLFWPCVILLSVFIADATTTLLRRMAKGERWYEPHRSHAYQKLARRAGHLRIALGVAAINVLLLGPVAWFAWRHPRLGFPLTLAVNAALAVFALTVRDRAGESSS